jgi:dinuclear metal center YbgI/SA1388 family protein
MTADELSGYLDELLHVSEIPDHPNALNGLQVQRSGEVRRIAVAVDAAQATIAGAIAGGADLLIVHHGLFWEGLRPLTGRRYERVRALLTANVGLYSSHLPLDVHPEFGNNPVLARELGISLRGEFGDYRGVHVGVWGTLDLRREALAARLDELLGVRIRLIPGGKERVGRVGVVTGGGGGQIEAARSAGLDALITGEGAHHNFFDAIEGEINLYLGGHYATEVWGVKAVAEHLRERFGLETFFVDHPTGL